MIERGLCGRDVLETFRGEKRGMSERLRERERERGACV